MNELKPDSAAVISWRSLTARLLGVSPADDVEAALINRISKIVAENRSKQGAASFVALREGDVTGNNMPDEPVSLESEVSGVLASMKSLDLLNETAIAPRTASGLVIDSLCQTMMGHMGLAAHERDFTIMMHRVTAYFPETGKTKVYTATLTRRGESDVRSATAVTVGAPVGFAAQLALSGKFAGKKGLVIPTDPDVYRPVLAKLEGLGIKMHETVTEI